jgi:hypothetical protein
MKPAFGRSHYFGFGGLFLLGVVFAGVAGSWVLLTVLLVLALVFLTVGYSMGSQCSRPLTSRASTAAESSASSA